MLCFDYFPDHTRTIFFAGTARSGTTWISNLVNYKNEYRDIFEPFDPKQLPLIKHFPFNVYLRPDNRDPQFVEPARRVVTGQFRNPWADRYNRRLIAGQRIIKDIRVTHFVKWLQVNFPGMPIIYILRHPLAVVTSWRALGWIPRIEIYLNRPELVADHLQPYLPELQQAAAQPERSFDRYLFFWCIENSVPLNQFQSGEMHLMFYENLLVEPETELRRMFMFLKKPFTTDILAMLDRPSSQSRREASFQSRHARLDAWRTQLSSAEIVRSLEILALFGLDRFYTDAPMPNVPSSWADKTSLARENEL